MAEYIEKEKAIKLLTDSMDAYGTFSVERSIYMTARQKIKNIPAVDVAPVVHGKWVSLLDGDNIMPERYYKCSICGRIEKRIEPYCHCGARMDGAK